MSTFWSGRILNISEKQLTACADYVDLLVDVLPVKQSIVDGEGDDRDFAVVASEEVISYFEKMDGFSPLKEFYAFVDNCKI